jgi:hypothetical protein
MFNSKYWVLFLNEKWEPLKKIKLKSIPKINEFIFFEEVQKYFRVINVVHQIGKKESTIVVLTEFSPEK